MHNLSASVQAIGIPVLFAACGAVGRFTFQMVETRYQILTFIALAAAFELLRRPTAINGTLWRGMANGAAAAGAIIAVKWHLEGISPLVLRLMA